MLTISTTDSRDTKILRCIGSTSTTTSNSNSSYNSNSNSNESNNDTTCCRKSTGTSSIRRQTLSNTSVNHTLLVVVVLLVSISVLFNNNSISFCNGMALLGGSSSSSSSNSNSKSNNINNNIGKTLRLNVGGHIHEVSLALLERYPTSKLARTAATLYNNPERMTTSSTTTTTSSTDDNDSNNNNNDDNVNDSNTSKIVVESKTTTKTIFIDRDGQRFSYILDYMRDGYVDLPISISKGSFINDMKYYGLVDIDSNSNFILKSSETLITNTDTTKVLEDTIHIRIPIEDLGMQMLQLINQREQLIIEIRKKVDEATMLELTNYCFGEVITKRSLIIKLPKEYNFYMTTLDKGMFNRCIKDLGLYMIDYYIDGPAYYIQLDYLQLVQKSSSSSSQSQSQSQQTQSSTNNNSPTNGNPTSGTVSLATVTLVDNNNNDNDTMSPLSNTDSLLT